MPVWLELHLGHKVSICRCARGTPRLRRPLEDDAWLTLLLTGGQEGKGMRSCEGRLSTGSLLGDRWPSSIVHEWMRLNV